MPADDTYRITLYGRINNQTIINTFAYAQLTGTDNADNLFDLFEADVLPALYEIASASYVLDRVTVLNLEDATDFWQTNVGVNGNVSGENMPTHDAWSFEWVTNRTDCKSGGKRIAGVIESVLNNGIPSATFLIKLAQFMGACESNLVSANGTWRPCVVGKRRGTLGLFNNFISGIRLVGCTTQNSRKFYTN